MAEPITASLVITGIAGGAAGAFVKSLADNGVTWLVELVSAHSPAVQAKSRKNMENFLSRLSQRVERLEQEIDADQKIIFKEALEHPSCSFLLQKATTLAATTDSEERHTLLSELIAQRLTAGADDMIALTGAAACEVVTSLTTRQIHMLALLTTLYSVRIDQLVATDLSSYRKVCVDYWKFCLSPLLTEDIEKIVYLDYNHLTAMGCLTMSIGHADLSRLLSLKSQIPEFTFDLKDLDQIEWWPRLSTFWKNGADRVLLTSVGMLIGILHRDSISKTKTIINW